MRQKHATIGYLAALVFILISVSYGQSLGDVARQQRQNQQAKKDQPAPKVITNEDLAGKEAADDDSQKTAQNHDEPHPATSKSAEQWRTEIEAQKHSVAELQSRMERLNSSIRFAEASRYYTAGQYNQRQEQKQEQVQRMQDQLDQQRKKLEEMQEGARKDGYGNAVYEP